MNVKLPMVIGSIGLTAACWGIYGPLLKWGQDELGGNRMRAFLCVGIAYFLIAVVVPTVMMYASGKKGKWSAKGISWSLAAGAVGAVGALGIIFAFNFGGKPVYVMPLVFGCAPVINSFWTIYWQKTWKDINAFFAAGLILVAVGGMTVLFFAPHKAAAGAAALRVVDYVLIVASVGVTAACWGIYGPLLHWGQMGLGGDRLRAFLCVGISYFVIAVIVPVAMLAGTVAQSWTASGAMWALASGAAGAFGALGVILAFNYGGKPVYVMPLIFGCAPVINSFWTIYWTGTWGELSPFFAAGLILAAVGAMTVLFFAPTQHKPAGGDGGKKSEPPASDSRQAASGANSTSDAKADASTTPTTDDKGAAGASNEADKS